MSRIRVIRVVSHSTKFYSIRLTIFASFGAEAIYELWSALSNVLAKLLTVISSGLAVNAQRRKYESKTHFTKHLS